MTIPSTLFALASFSTFFCTAVNAYTLCLGYPLWRAVPPKAFAALHREYLRRLAPVVISSGIMLGCISFLLEGRSARDIKSCASVERKSVGLHLFYVQYCRSHNPLVHSNVRNPPHV